MIGYHTAKKIHHVFTQYDESHKHLSEKQDPKQYMYHNSTCMKFQNKENETRENHIQVTKV